MDQKHKSRAFTCSRPLKHLEVTIGIAKCRNGAAANELLNAHRLAGPVQPIEAVQTALVNALQKSDETQAHQILDEAFALFAPEQAALQVIQPTMHEIGERLFSAPETVKKLAAGGRHAILVQSGAGLAASVPDKEFEAAGAKNLLHVPQVHRPSGVGGGGDVVHVAGVGSGLLGAGLQQAGLQREELLRVLHGEGGLDVPVADGGVGHVPLDEVDEAAVEVLHLLLEGEGPPPVRAVAHDGDGAVLDETYLASIAIAPIIPVVTSMTEAPARRG